ncbi:MAG: hypothetical protein IH840_09020 [Candidatus Heimdallarchaeota archaeon]|nr:hypothetical protein [Candidatus Heimdallarchaeota archaeon]
MEPVYREYFLQLTILDREFYDSDLYRVLSDSLNDLVFTQETSKNPIPYNYRDTDRMSTLILVIIMKEVEAVFTTPDRSYVNIAEFEFVLADTERTLYSPLKYTINNTEGMVKARNFGFIDQRRIRLLSIISAQIHRLSYETIRKLEILLEDKTDRFLNIANEFDEMTEDDLINLLIRAWTSTPHRKWIYTDVILDILSKISLAKIVMLNPHDRLVKMARGRL